MVSTRAHFSLSFYRLYWKAIVKGSRLLVAGGKGNVDPSVLVLPSGNDYSSIDKYLTIWEPGFHALSVLSLYAGPRVWTAVCAIGSVHLHSSLLHFIPAPGVLSFWPVSSL